MKYISCGEACRAQIYTCMRFFYLCFYIYIYIYKRTHLVLLLIPGINFECDVRLTEISEFEVHFAYLSIIWKQFLYPATVEHVKDLYLGTGSPLFAYILFNDIVPSDDSRKLSFHSQYSTLSHQARSPFVQCIYKICTENETM